MSGQLLDFAVIKGPKRPVRAVVISVVISTAISRVMTGIKNCIRARGREVGSNYAG